VEKYRRAGLAIEENMAHMHCVLDTQGYKYTLRICNTGCPTTYQTRHFFNNSKTNEDTAMRFEQEYVRCVGNVTAS